MTSELMNADDFVVPEPDPSMNRRTASAMPKTHPRKRSKKPPPGLQRAGARLPIDEYTRRLWHRRWFVVAYSTMRRTRSASSAVSSAKPGSC